MRSNVAARLGGWSTRHRKTAIIGWLVFVVAATLIGGRVGQETMADHEFETGDSAKADQILDEAGITGQAGEMVLLHTDGEELGAADRGNDLLLIDCAWRRVPDLLARVDGVLHARRLPEFVSAYPRKSKTHADPAHGLASVEALFVATLVLGQPRPELLQHYRWRDAFLAANRERIERLLL